MIYDPSTATLLRLLERKLEQYGRFDAFGQKAKKEKARLEINTMVRRLKSLDVIEPYVQEIA